MHRRFNLRCLLLAQALACACSGDGPQQSTGDTNTNWLKKCDFDSECEGGFSCLCGSCTIGCELDDDCSHLSEQAVCTLEGLTCPDVQRTCQRAETVTDGGAPTPTPSASGTGSSSSAPDASQPAPSLPVPSSPTAPTGTAPSPAPPVELEGAQGLDGWSAEPGVGSAQTNAVTIGPNGGVFVAGGASATPDVPPDAFAGWYSPTDGTVLWTDTFGTDGSDIANDIALDSEGNIYVVGSTQGPLNDTTQNQGSSGDAFIVQYSSMGQLSWTQLIASEDMDAANGVSIDSAGSIVVTGTLGAADGLLPWAFVANYSPAGERQWLRELGAPEGGTTIATDIATSPTDGTTTIVGWTDVDLTDGAPGLTDAFVAQYSSIGDLNWVRQFGTPEIDEAYAVAIDPQGNVYVAGSSFGDIDGPRSGNTDAFLAKYLPGGQLEWLAGYGSEADDLALGIALDAFGNIYVSGASTGTLGGQNLGAYDGYLIKFSATAEIGWAQQFGGADNDYAQDVAADAADRVFVVGADNGVFNVGAVGNDSSGFIRQFL